MASQEVLKKSIQLLREHLSSLSESEKEELRERFRDKRPKGWLSIEDHLPMMFANDIMQGYSVFKVKDDCGNEFDSRVTDHNIWYYDAKESGITHWLNK